MLIGIRFVVEGVMRKSVDGVFEAVWCFYGLCDYPARRHHFRDFVKTLYDEK